jgi:hypothetical protein
VTRARQAASLHRVDPSYTGAIPSCSAVLRRTLRVGTPKAYLESGSNRIPFLAATLQCSPNYRIGRVRAVRTMHRPSSTTAFPDGRPMCVTNAECGPGETCTTATVLHVTADDRSRFRLRRKRVTTVAPGPK